MQPGQLKENKVSHFDMHFRVYSSFSSQCYIICKERQNYNKDHAGDKQKAILALLMARGVWKIIHPFVEMGKIKLRLLSYQCTFNNSVNPIGGSAPSLAPTLAQGYLSPPFALRATAAVVGCQMTLFKYSRILFVFNYRFGKVSSFPLPVCS